MYPIMRRCSCHIVCVCVNEFFVRFVFCVFTVPCPYFLTLSPLQCLGYQQCESTGYWSYILMHDSQVLPPRSTLGKTQALLGNCTGFIGCVLLAVDTGFSGAEQDSAC